MPTMTPQLILASASPRRSALLHQLGVAHRVMAADIEERRGAAEDVVDCVRRLAQAKAAAARERLQSESAASGAGASNGVVLGADTAVVLGDEMLGKPRDSGAALGMLRQLSGREHRVLTGVAVWSGSGCEVALSESWVQFRPLSESELQRYWSSGEPCGKAGAYAIQGYAAAFIAGLRGSYSGVMGLPLYETAELLARAGVPIWREPGRQE
jgi:septum formation protein